MSLVLTEKRGPIAILTLNRADTLNPLGLAGDGLAMRDACEAINGDPEIRCVILTGAGRAFSAGGDVKAMKAREGAFSGGPVQVREGYRHNIHRIVRALHLLEVPSIAAVNGPAIGLGCDVACLADIRIASDKAKFGVTFVKLGIIPGDGGAWLLPRIVGMSKACELLFTGRVIGAEQAEAWGLVSRVVPHDTLMAEALALAGEIAQQPPHALRMAKTLLRQGQSSDLDAILELSAASQAIAHMTEDHEEGVDAILAKRKPVFNGR